REQIRSYVARLRAGESAFVDEPAEGRSRSLGASLAYGFEQAFRPDERRVIALLHLFQGYIDVDVFCLMGIPDEDWCLEEVRQLDFKTASALLDRAAEVGHLSKLGEGYYRLHPALSWFLRPLFERSYPDDGERAMKAFAEIEGDLADYYVRQYERGRREVLPYLRAEEPNLLQARRLARAYGWGSAVVRTMQGLAEIIGRTPGRRAEWRRLVEEIVPDFVDPETDGPLPGREKEWGFVTGYRVALAHGERRWSEAERLRGLDVMWSRNRAGPFLALPADCLTWEQYDAIRSLATSLRELAHIQRETGRSHCVPTYEEALALGERIGDRALASTCAYQLGHAYQDLRALRDLDHAETWYKRSLELQGKHDTLSRGRTCAQLGTVAYERYCAGQRDGGCVGCLPHHLAEAARLFGLALQLLPADAETELDVAHKGLGTICLHRGDPDRALHHFRHSLRWAERSAERFSAAQTRELMARALLAGSRRSDALHYAEAALRAFESLDGGTESAEKARQLVEQIRQSLDWQG
ncbi:MAG TPA: tetratricopeptide repeat protein, partial [Thermoanaerobaculia bacterium]